MRVLFWKLILASGARILLVFSSPSDSPSLVANHKSFFQPAQAARRSADAKLWSCFPTRREDGLANWLWGLKKLLSRGHLQISRTPVNGRHPFGRRERERERKRTEFGEFFQSGKYYPPAPTLQTINTNDTFFWPDPKTEMASVCAALECCPFSWPFERAGPRAEEIIITPALGYN